MLDAHHNLAAITGLRNFVRDIGSAVGITGKCKPPNLNAQTANHKAKSIRIHTQQYHARGSTVSF